MTYELFVDVPGFESCYRVSNKGRVMSKDRTVHRSDGSKQKYKARTMRPQKRGHYLKICLQHEKRKLDISIHRLVLLAFIGPSEKQVNHKNGQQHDNRLENLEYCTASENTLHSYRVLGNKAVSGVDNGQAKLTDQDILEMVEMRKNGAPLREIGRKYKVSGGHVGDIMRGKYRNSEIIELNLGKKIPDKEIRKIFELKEGGMLQKDIASMYGVGQQSISRIIRGESRSEHR